MDLFVEAEVDEGVEGEGGVADPGVAVVPVLGAADPLGQRGRRRGGDGPGLLVQSVLSARAERTDRAVHGPAAATESVHSPPATRRCGPAGRRRLRAGTKSGSSSVATTATRERPAPPCEWPPDVVRSTSAPAQPSMMTAEGLVPSIAIGMPVLVVIQGWPAERSPGTQRPGHATKPLSPSTRWASSLHGVVPQIRMFEGRGDPAPIPPRWCRWPRSTFVASR